MSKTTFYMPFRGQLILQDYLCNRIEVLRKNRGYTQELKILNKTLDNLEKHMEKHNPYYIKKGRNMVSSYGSSIFNS
ncbi:metallopeptidase [Bacillus phage vB_BcgM]|nr:metallopeptidase [Bacillus phage vB_BcgM]